ncbi:hypothetical protein [Streptomyces sp. NPDC089799]|uniref:hypothetical protein n=1 Tax=Streptomyces sp. NPDC089799 TaxID=3155066 RepID=UPI00343CF06A
MGIFDFLKHDKKAGAAGKETGRSGEPAGERSREPSGAPGRMAAQSRPATPHPAQPTTHTPPEAAKRSAPPQHDVLRGPMPEKPVSPHVTPGTAKRSAPVPSKHEDTGRKQTG